MGQGGVTATNDRSVDLLTALKGLPLLELWSRRRTIRYRGARILVVPGGTGSVCSVPQEDRRTWNAKVLESGDADL
ncbi:MAG: hypothetical protein ACT4OI_09360 [Methanobacteriota archaeon]